MNGLARLGLCMALLGAAAGAVCLVAEAPPKQQCTPPQGAARGVHTELAPIDAAARPQATAPPQPCQSASEALARDPAALESAPGKADTAAPPTEYLRWESTDVARLLFEQGDAEAALEELSKQLALTPADGNLYSLRSHMYRDLGRLEHAVADLARASELGELTYTKAEIRGHVVDASGRGVAGAAVHLELAALFHSSHGAAPPTHRSGPDGSFAFEVEVPTTTVTLVAEAEGHAPSQPTALDVTSGAPVALQLGTESRIELRVHDARSGLPVRHAMVHVDQDLHTVDEQGYVSVGSLSDQLHSVRVLAEGYTPWAHENVAASPNAVHQLRVDLQPGRSLSGVVRNPAGEVVPGAPVHTPDSLVFADEEGRYLFEDLPAGQTVVWSEGDGAGVMHQVDPDRTQVLDLTLEPLAQLEVLLRRAGAPVSLRVTVNRTHGETPPIYRDPSTNAFAPLVAGEVELVVSNEGVILRRRATLAPGQLTRVEWDLPSGELRARLLNSAGVPASKAWIVLYQGGQRAGSAVANEQGLAVLNGLASGLYDVYARDAQRKEVKFLSNVALPGELEITIPVGGRINGQLIDPSGTPLTGLEVTLNGVTHPTTRTVTADAEGRFVIEELYDGSYSLQVDADALQLEALRRGFPSLTLDPLQLEASAGHVQQLDLRPR